MLMPYLFIMNWITPASRSPQRVPIGRPTSGVKPMDVSTHLPPSIAQMELPLPMWQEMSLSSSMGLPMSSAQRADT